MANHLAYVFHAIPAVRGRAEHMDHPHPVGVQRHRLDGLSGILRPARGQSGEPVRLVLIQGCIEARSMVNLGAVLVDPAQEGFEVLSFRHEI